MATLTTGSNSSEPRFYISAYNTIIGKSVFFKFDVPTLIDSNNNIKSIDLFTGDRDDKGLPIKTTLDLNPNTPISDNITYTYTNVGTYYISYEVTYVNNTKKTYYVETPIQILSEWPEFNQENIRILGENILTLPYSFDQIQINPNEYGVYSVYNNSIKKLHECLEYLKFNSRILNSKTPFLYYGWLGVNFSSISSGLSWHTLNYNTSFYSEINFSDSLIRAFGNQYKGFLNIRDIAETDNLIFALDDKGLRVFKNSNKPSEIVFTNKDEILNTLTYAVSMDIDTEGKKIYLLDSIQNSLYRIDIDYDFTNSLFEEYNPLLSFTLKIGTYGDESDPFSFNNPIQIVYSNGFVYVLDYNNNCVKTYNENLEWVFTYNPVEFKTDIPISIAVHPKTNFVYVLTKNNVYILPHKSNLIEFQFDLGNIKSLIPKKIFFDENGEFFYIITENSTDTEVSTVFKYTALGLYMDFLELPQQVKLTTGKAGKNRNILLAHPNAILKCQEITDILKTGEGLNVNYWTLDQLLLKPDEMNQNLVINRTLSRLCQNILSFKNSLESKLELNKEFTVAGEVSYFRLYPVKSELRPYLGNEVENLKIGVGVNELHVPSVLNREFKIIYDSLLLLKSFLDIEPTVVENEIGKNLEKCKTPFCWSWKAMSTYYLKKPIVRICNVNPISFKELESNFASDFVPSKSWEDATSDCCSQVKTPLDIQI